MHALGPSCFNLANLKSSFEKEPVISRFVQSHWAKCCVYVWGEGLCTVPVHGLCKKPSFSDLAGVCVTGPEKGLQLQNNLSKKTRFFFLLKAHLCIFIFRRWAGTWLFSADALQNWELMPFVWCKYNLSWCVWFSWLCWVPALNSIKSLISNNFPRLSGDYNDALAHSSNRKCLLGKNSASVVCSLYSLQYHRGGIEKPGLVQYWCIDTIISFLK